MAALKAVAEGVARFDAKRLPFVALLDTTVWLRAFGWESDNDNVCADFVEAMLHHDRRMLICAPTIIELLRSTPGREIPNWKNITRVPLSAQAALEIGAKIAAAGIFAPVDTTGAADGSAAAERPTDNPVQGQGAALKFDTMIAGIASVSKARYVVTLDRKNTMTRACKAFGLEHVRPSDFLIPPTPQMHLDEVMNRV